jgi:TolA-binding protein
MNNDCFEPSTDAQCAEDLLALERRRDLTDHERRRLGMCLAASDALRTLRQLDQDLEAVQPNPADEARIVEQCVTSARRRFTARRHTPRGVRRRVRAVLASAPLLLVAFGAAAALYHWVPPLVAPRQQPSDASAAPVKAPERRGAGVRTEHEKVSTVAAPSASVSAASPALAPMAEHEGTAAVRVPRSNVQTEPSAATSAPVLASSTSAAGVFSAANAARRAGDTRRAIALYSQLQTEYPQSDEALVSYVLMARLELSRGAPAVALRQFDAYLARSAAGSLSQEALQGKAQALSSLGRKEEAAATWRRLLREFPNSVYAQSAREHLAESAR